jgi:hypothetical protein
MNALSIISNGRNFLAMNCHVLSTILSVFPFHSMRGSSLKVEHWRRMEFHCLNFGMTVLENYPHAKG